MSTTGDDELTRDATGGLSSRTASKGPKKKLNLKGKIALLKKKRIAAGSDNRRKTVYEGAGRKKWKESGKTLKGRRPIGGGTFVKEWLREAVT